MPPTFSLAGLNALCHKLPHKGTPIYEKDFDDDSCRHHTSFTRGALL